MAGSFRPSVATFELLPPSAIDLPPIRASRRTTEQLTEDCCCVAQAHHRPTVRVFRLLALICHDHFGTGSPRLLPRSGRAPGCFRGFSPAGRHLLRVPCAPTARALRAELQRATGRCVHRAAAWFRLQCQGKRRQIRHLEASSCTRHLAPGGRLVAAQVLRDHVRTLPMCSSPVCDDLAPPRAALASLRAGSGCTGFDTLQAYHDGSAAPRTAGRAEAGSGQRLGGRWSGARQGMDSEMAC